MGIPILISDRLYQLSFIRLIFLLQLILHTLTLNRNSICESLWLNCQISLLKSSYKPSSSLRPKSKRRLSESVKKIVASNQRWTCNMCHNILDASYEVDHIIPLYKGGSNDINNLQALCRNCHGMKTINDKLNI